MSRIVVKNLPKKITQKELSDTFSSMGCITDLQLKYNKNGKFRQFAFVGYKTDEEAQNAKEYFNNTFIKASKVQVEICTNLWSENKPKPWDKTEKVASPSKIEKPGSDNVKEKNSKKLKKVLSDYPEELQKDKRFSEFLKLNEDRKSKPVWADDAVNLKEDDKSESSENDSDDEASTTKSKELTDLEYLKSKTVTSDKEKDEKQSQVCQKESEKIHDDRFTVKLRNLPYGCKKKDVKQFFNPLKFESLRLPPKQKGFGYVKFRSEKELKQALNKNKGVLNGHKVDVIVYVKKDNSYDNKQNFEESREKNIETLAESGRLFVRNLCFDVTEEELKEVFSKYGPITELTVPIDSFTKKAQGFAFISYVFAEHAVQAFTELDGTIFQGRVLHIIPGKPKENKVDLSSLSYKQRKDAKLKALSGSDHNWNVLFLGMNAVADTMSKKYNISKQELLNSEGDESIAVRMALCETQLVKETREFLIQNGVKLDAFSQAAAERSNTVIIAKNLPANTTSEELLEVFTRYGIVERVVIPPDGVTALVEFQLPAEAKTAFRKLAYSRFRHLPLYLEWAPMNIFRKGTFPNKQEPEKSEDKDAESAPVEAVPEIPEDLPPDSGVTLFIKNLNFTTTEEVLSKHFSSCGPLYSCSISQKWDIKSGKKLSMGFGFVQFKYKSSAVEALQQLQGSELEGHTLELKFSNRATIAKAEVERKKSKLMEQKTAKILVRNVPFEMNETEMRDLFKEFGNLKSVRLPKKMGGDGSHRGFAFVEFREKANAKRA